MHAAHCRGFLTSRPVLGLSLALLLLLSLGRPVVGQTGIEDQRNTPPTGSSHGCGSAGLPIFQSFTPRGRDLLAAEIHLRIGGGFPDAGVDLSLLLHEGAPDGPVIGKAARQVAAPQAPASTYIARFDFQPAPALVPGAVYVLEFASPLPAGEPSARVASWFGADGDPYPRGAAFGCSANLIEGRDYLFVTYTSAIPEPGDEPTPRAAEATPTPSEPVCWQIRDRVPRDAIDAALAAPRSVLGYDQLENPAKPEGPFNRRRRWLTIQALALPYHPLHNGLLYRAGCP